MATYHEIPRPPRFRGTEQEKWRQLEGYLTRMAELLENIINHMTQEGVKKDAKT